MQISAVASVFVLIFSVTLGLCGEFGFQNCRASLGLDGASPIPPRSVPIKTKSPTLANTALGWGTRIVQSNREPISCNHQTESA